MADSYHFNMKSIRPLTQQEINSFKEFGFLVYKADCVRHFKGCIINLVKEITLIILTKMGCRPEAIAELEDKSFDEIVQWCHENETHNKITKILYEVYPTMPAIIGCINHQLLIWLAQSIGIKKPVASTIPTIRIDRPNTDKFLTLSHQDYWYSFASDNSVTIWCPLISITEEMGHLQVIPGSHKNGLVPFTKRIGDNLLSVQKDYPDEYFQAVDLAVDEILLFSQYLIHKSGLNRGHMPRVTMQVRYNDVYTMTELIQTFTATTSAIVLERQQNLLSRFESSLTQYNRNV